MSAYNRYEFIKNLYSNYIIFIKKKDKYYTYYLDNFVLQLLKVDYYKKIENYKINYLLIDNLEVVSKVCYRHNNYNKYLVIYLINDIFNIIKKRNDVI